MDNYLTYLLASAIAFLVFSVFCVWRAFRLHEELVAMRTGSALAREIALTAPKCSMQNKDAIEPETLCGCYFCIRTFPGAAVEEYADDGSALCPTCELDAVWPGQTDPKVLRAAHEMWFCGMVA